LNLSNIFSIICIVNFFLIDFIFDINNKLSPIGVVFFGMFFLTLPIILLIITGINLKKSINGRKWPQVRGRISSIQLEDGIFNLILGQKFTMVYDYYVKDRPHSNDQFNPMKTSVKFKDLFHNHQLRNKSYSEIEGTIVKVYFNPNNPWESMLCNSTYFEFNILLLPSANALIIAGYLFYCIY
jgi:hypothetical protein